jgi:hypothetical protein
MTKSVNDRQAMVRSVCTDQWVSRVDWSPHVIRWSGYTRQSRTEITQLASQHSHALNV